MSGFKALNIESDDESDVEVDDTKELQIEEALKLYQTALKYHADGPASFELAADAYDKLFKSEIFQYPESQTELRRIELYGPGPEAEELWALDQAAEVTVAAVGLEGGPSTLPQILHLSHKNYGQFKLEYLKSRLDSLQTSLNDLVSDAATALDHFTEALDKDDSDLDLWRRTASVGGMLDSKRVTRFCLEAVLDGDEEGLSGMMSLPGLEESLAGEQLRDLVQRLGDQLSVLQSPMLTGERKTMSKMLKRRLALYPNIINRGKTLRIKEKANRALFPKRKVLPAPQKWSELGDVLLKFAETENVDPILNAPGTAIYFDLAETPATNQVTAKPETQPQSAITPPNGHGIAEVQENVDAQFPGTDSGKPTVQPQIPPADAESQNVIEASQDRDKATSEAPETVSLPTRKRSGDAAGVNDGPEEGRTKSKRTRTRDSTVADEKQAMIDANIRWEYEQQLNEFQAADDWMFETAGNLFERIGVIGLEAGKDVRQEFPSSPSANDAEPVTSMSQSQDGLKLAKSDIHAFLKDYSDRMGKIFVSQGDDPKVGQSSDLADIAGGASNGDNSKSSVKAPVVPDNELYPLLVKANETWMQISDVAWEWLMRLLRPENLRTRGNSYLEHTWPEHLKTMIVRILIYFDSSVFQKTQELLECWKEYLDEDADEKGDKGLVEMVQTIFEIHLDVYCLIKEHNSGVDFEVVSAQNERLVRWSELAREAMHFRSMTGDELDLHDQLNLRFLWATTYYLGASTDITQDHVVECMNDLRATLAAAPERTVHLPNNAVMPEVSIAALDRETSRLATKDFFLKVSSPSVSDPVSIIENLEPLLECLETSTENEETGSSLPAGISSELVGYLRNSDLSIRLMLWRRLREAYTAIDYKPMVVSCYLRTIKLVFDEMKAQIGPISSQSDRQVTILKSLGMLKEIILRCLSQIQETSSAFECIDEDLLKTSVSMFGEILQLVQVFNLSEDSIRVGQTQPPMQPNGQPVASFVKMNAQLHEMQIRIWIIMYRLLKEATFQFHELFPTPKEDQFDFLRAVHRNMGLRSICGASNRAFVLMLRDEFFQMTHVEGYDSEQAQVLYDLYGLNAFLDPNYELMEHHCKQDTFFNRDVAAQTVDLVISQASKLPIKDLTKHQLKDTIEKVHGHVSRKRPTEAILRNRELCRAFLRSPINPMDLYSCLKGEGNQLATSYVPKDDAPLAAKGWYFLMGHIALTKFRSQKRTAPTPTEDVDIAVAFFMQEIEYSMDNWETWFRLGQAYDTRIEESVVWSAEKLNSNMTEIVNLQRAAIHCFTMATALAHRSADLTFETSEKMTELYQDFALRIYASSREPFNMLPFAMDEEDKFLSVPNGIGKGKPYQPLRLYTAWKLAKNLLQRTIEGKSQSWFVHYMLGKCLWKMHSASDKVALYDVRPADHEVLDCFIKAIELIPDKKDSREKREPVLEPHYKLVSVINKLVTRGKIGLAEAKYTLEHTTYSRAATFPVEMDGWVPYILAVLKSLRTADKSNWHHRMIMRAASIIYENPNRLAEEADATEHQGALGAKNELTQQMFTKTMVLQVWRPDCERAGRHFVFTARYTRFFVKILEQLKDRSNLEMLARRVRRRPHDYFEHTLVWQDICNAYLRLLRNHAAIADGLETSTFSNIAHDEFAVRKEPLEKWMQTQETGQSAALDVLREVQELKKINQSLMKPGAIDDLIGDSYAYLFGTIGKELWDKDTRQKQEDDRRQKEEEEARRPAPPTIVAPTAVQSPPRNPMMSLTHLMNMDGGADGGAGTLTPSGAASAPQHQQQQPSTKPSTPQPSDSAAPAAATRRKVGVGRREIRNCAEACYQKQSSSATTGTSGTGNNSSSTSKPLTLAKVLIPYNPEAANGLSSLDNSRRGSVVPDSGVDDEDEESELSELSELEEVEEGEGGEGEEDEAVDDDDDGDAPSNDANTGPNTGGAAGGEKTEDDGNEGDDEGEGAADATARPVSPATRKAKRRTMFPGLLENLIVESRDSSVGVERPEREVLSPGSRRKQSQSQPKEEDAEGDTNMRDGGDGEAGDE